MNQLFDQYPEDASQEFVTFRDSDWEPAVAARVQIERMWTVFSPYADSQFTQEFSKQFAQRFWELYLGYTLLSQGHRLQPRSSGAAPDFRIESDPGLVWIEAIAPTKGVGKHAVQPLVSDGKVQLISHREMMLRLTHAFTTKAHVFRDEYLADQVTSDTDILIVAISSCAWGHMRLLHGATPDIVRSLLGIGDLVASFHDSDADASFFLKGMDRISKGKADIRTDYFRNRDYSFVSGVIYSNADPCNIPTTIGSDLLFIRNPHALNPVPSGWLKIGHEYYLEDGHLVCSKV